MPPNVTNEEFDKFLAGKDAWRAYRKSMKGGEPALTAMQSRVIDYYNSPARQ
jgi:hypothetical protein